MQEFISLYNENREDIEKFLIETLRNNGQIMHNNEAEIQRFFRVFPSLELVYVTDSDFVQVSSNIYKNRRVEEAKGKNRAYLVSKVEPKEQNVSISSPYISSATGETCVTVLFYGEDYNYFFDFNLTTLLTRFGLVERHPLFNQFSKGFYFIIGLSLTFFSVMSIGYAFYDYFLQLVHPAEYSLESVFKPIVALTMGLAIFDLAKTLLEREVFFKAYSDKKDESRLLSKFLSAIIIALSIEALMVVFKTALNDPTQMLYALYLIIGVALIILSLALYNKLVIRDGECKE
ncbi:PDC sensor domain-containing protein [Thiomicrorhabdus cannonii]|uniref:PDC sensor domain-containing protein n=1 Tax=Thiomicrorhabdus cannonii TaxID=2748011 RepID=UPI0015BD6BE4|nr:PDC sensor domain-containing protein [Thiomicrorhabdus cannonii]